MKKPQPKQEVAIRVTEKQGRLISMCASQDAIEEFKSFGEVIYQSGVHYLFVDARYDFDEVLAYIQSYGNEEEL